MPQALCLTIECSEWRDTELSGKNLHSLLDLLLNQASQVRVYIYYNECVCLECKESCVRVTPDAAHFY